MSGNSSAVCGGDNHGLSCKGCKIITGCHAKAVAQITTPQDSWEGSEQRVKLKLTFDIWGRFQKSDRAQTIEKKKTMFIRFNNKGPSTSLGPISVECWTQKLDYSCLLKSEWVESVETGWMLASGHASLTGGL